MLPFTWYQQAYFIPWAKGSINRNLPAKLIDNAEIDFDYRTALEAWNNKAKLGSKYVLDEATQISLVAADMANAAYIAWIQLALVISGEGKGILPTGSLDLKTTQAIKKFQKDRMSTAKQDGLVGAKTETALFLRSKLKPPGRFRPIPSMGNFEIPAMGHKELPDKPIWETHSSTWIGIGLKIGGMGMTEFKGQEHVAAHMVNFDRPESSFRLIISGTRKGFGGGVSGGIAAVFITGIYEPDTLNSVELEEFDFSIATGLKLSSAVKALKFLHHVTGLKEILTAIRAIKVVPKGKAWLDVIDGLKKAAESLDIDSDSTEVSCTVIDVSAGIEGALFTRVSRFKVSNIHLAE